MIRVRDVPASIGWILCSRYLPVHKDIVRYLLSRLFKDIILYEHIRGVTWDPFQLEMYRALYIPSKRQITIINERRRNGNSFAVAGIAASFSAKGMRVAILVSNKRTTNYMHKKIAAMGCAEKELIDVMPKFDTREQQLQYDVTLIDTDGHSDVYEYAVEHNLKLLQIKW